MTNTLQALAVTLTLVVEHRCRHRISLGGRCVSLGYPVASKIIPTSPCSPSAWGAESRLNTV